MAVVIEELDIVTEPPPSPPSAANGGSGPDAAPAVDERELLRMLARQAWRDTRVQAD